MSDLRVLLVGYYGKGNFGDDVLLLASHTILRTAIPDAQISILIDGDAGGYVPAMLGGDVTILPPGRHGHFDLIIHGGGGVFFDFTQHGMWGRYMELALRAIGYRWYLALEHALRIAFDRTRTSASKRLGFGIGVGTYSTGSPRFRAALPILADFTALWVRDAHSVTNLQRFETIMRGEVIRGSDLAFLTRYWLKTPAVKSPSPRPRLGMILRDWAQEKGGVPREALSATLARLAQEYEISGIVLDQHADPETMRLFAPYTLHVWRPESMTIDGFMRILATQDVLLTSRAHGAICGACVGVPSVIIGIEEKLETVAAMLPNASILVPPRESLHWPAALAKARMITPATIAADVTANRAASEAALSQMQVWLR